MLTVFYQLFSPHNFSIIDRTTAEIGVTLSFLQVQSISQTITKRSTLLLVISQHSLKKKKAQLRNYFSSVSCIQLSFLLLPKIVMTTLKLRN